MRHSTVGSMRELPAKGPGEIEPKILLESVSASQTMFCGGSAMLSKAFPIAYKVILNGADIGVGQASFTHDGEQANGEKRS